MKKIIPFFIVLAALMAGLSSCHRDNSFTPTQRAALIFHLHHYINDTHITAGQMAYDDSGRRYQLNVGRFYISQITLHGADGTDWQSYGKYTITAIGTEEYLVDSVPVGNYKSISFTVGLDPTTNTTDPSQHSSGALAEQSPSMYFGEGKGYIFMNIQGRADTSAAQNGDLNIPFSYQIGTDNLSRTVNMPANSFSMVAYQSQTLDIKVDYSVFLQSINFKTQAACTPFSDEVFATTLANRIPKMFSWGM
jgi:hypothetical protein